MHEIILCNNALPSLCGCDFLAASEPFYHADRTADFNVLIYVTEGVIYVTEDGTDYAVKEGELLFLKSHVHHCGKYEIPRGTKWYFMHFLTEDNDWLPMFSHDSSPIPQYSSISCRIALPKMASGLSGSYFEQRLSSFVDYFHSDDPYRKWNLNLRLHELLSGLCEEFSRNTSPTLSDRICSYLTEHLREPFSADALSREFYLSYKRLAAVFKEEKGVTMQQYHTKLRMSEAKRLLRSTLMPVGEIAAQLGFADMLYFSRRFHESTGYSPTEYRKLPQTY